MHIDSYRYCFNSETGSGILCRRSSSSPSDFLAKVAVLDLNSERNGFIYYEAIIEFLKVVKSIPSYTDRKFYRV